MWLFFGYFRKIFFLDFCSQTPAVYEIVQKRRNRPYFSLTHPPAHKQWELFAFMHFFFIKAFFYEQWRFTGLQRKGLDDFYSSLPLPLAHEYSDIYLQLCAWYDYHVFLIASYVITGRVHDETYHLWAFTFEWLLTECWFQFCLII